MENIVSTFFQSHYTEEQCSLLYRGLGLLEVFNYSTPVVGAIQEEIMREQDQHAEQIRDNIWDLIESGLDKVFFAHRITLENEPPLTFKVLVLEALFGFTYRETYQPFVTILENWTVTPTEKLCKILAEMTSEDETYFHEYIDWVYEGTMTRLSEFANTKAKQEEEASDIELLKEIRKGLKVFEQAFGTPKAIEGIIEVNPVPGALFQNYLDLFFDEMIDMGDLESTVWRLIYVALLSEDGYNNPQKLLLEKNAGFFPELSLMNKVNGMIQKAMGRYQEFKEHAK